jgi:hypothetical protein
MSQTFEQLDEELIGFIARQKMFFVATAPLSGEGSVNLSPKGYETFLVLDEKTVAYLDLGGSGAETMAHVQENGRITLMFCAFDGAPKILRLYGRGRAVALHDPEFAALLARFPGYDRARAVIVVELSRIADSCGWSIPFFDYRGERDQLRRWIDHRPLEEWTARRYASNAQSIDGLPALVRPEAD